MSREEPLIQEIIQFHAQDDHKSILRRIREIFLTGEKENLELLKLISWPLPTLDDYHFLGDFIHSNEVEHVYSIGCGSALLEWLLMKYLLESAKEQKKSKAVPVTGMEIDVAWWTSTYSPPTFLPLLFVDKDFTMDQSFGESNDMALFCYFNNLKIFVDYLKIFRGQFLAILGPVSTKQFCAPAPLELTEPNPDLPTRQWKLVTYQQFGLGDVDHLAIYKKINNGQLK